VHLSAQSLGLTPFLATNVDTGLASGRRPAGNRARQHETHALANSDLVDDEVEK
jgi:hypothetical protein